MARRRALLALTLVALVALAGCSAVLDGPVSGGATADPESPSPEAETAAEANETLPVDVYRVYDRVQAMVGSDAERPALEVRDMDEAIEDVYESRQGPFQEALNMTETDVDTENTRGIAWEDRVVVDPNDAGPADVEQTLVHEYFHAIQFTEGWYPRSDGLDARTATSTDYAIVEDGLVEGGAVWIADQYADRYQADGVRLQSERLTREYEAGPDGDRYFRAPYHFGERYVDARVDDPANVDEVYEDPPTTSEQLVHGLDPDEEPPTPLSIDADDGETWSLQRNDRMGELFVRVALRTELEKPVAADAAAGWGNDRLLGYRAPTGEWGFVWVLHWDTADDADEFDAAFETVLAERTDDRATETTVDRRDDRTVIVVGPDDFRDAVSIDGSGTELAVSTDGE